MTDHLPECDRVWNSDFAEHPCGICAMLTWVREDQTKILNTRVQYQSGYFDALDNVKQYALSLLNTELHLINEEIIIESIVGYIDHKLTEG
jgi:hypothetical protein